MSLKNCLTVLWVYVMYVLGIWIFFSGYLLKRIVVHQNNTAFLNVGLNIACHNFASLHSISGNFHKNQIQNFEFDPQIPTSFQESNLKRFNNAVIIIIDALRYDFTVFDNVSKEERHYLNKMPIFTNMLEKHPEKSLLLILEADPPTTTLQRLKGITTGSLPTFIDISLNFASSEVPEDNLIRQLNNCGKKVVFLGDDTWTSIYPGQFHRTFPYPSFNVKDLDTVDNGILDHIFLEMDKDDWDVIIAHFLGVDHCGHRYGPNHPAMSSKLQQMNIMIQDVISKLNEDTILFVLGDHGMTEYGDHGGDSPDEITTALFIYSPSDIVSSMPQDVKSAAQVDLVPTFALLLGLPIPFSNLGSIIPQLFHLQDSKSNESCFHKEVDPLLGATLALAENAFQVNQYLHKYTTLSDEIPKSVITTAELMLNSTSSLWNNIGEDIDETKNVLSNLSSGYKKYLAFVRSECNKIWATFNLEMMMMGMIVLGITVFLNIVIAQDMKFAIIIIILKPLAMIILYFQKPYIFFALSLAVVTICRKYLIECIEQLLQTLVKAISLPLIATSLLFLGSFSNSFVVYEDRTVLFLLQTIFIYRYLMLALQPFLQTFFCGTDKMKKNKHSLRKTSYKKFVLPLLFLSLVICVRMSFVFHKCREEQYPCETSSLLTSLESMFLTSYQGARLCMSWMAVILPMIVAMIASRYFTPSKTYTAAMICINYGIPFICILVCLHWWLSIVPPNVLDKILEGNQVIVARGAFWISIIVLLVTWAFPIIPEQPWEIATNCLYSGSLCLFTFSILLPLYLIAGDGLASAVTLMVISQLVSLILDSISSDISSESRTWLNIITWGLFSYHWFYGTGHQSTFPAIQWEAAFLVNKEISSYFLSGTLVVLNTFSSQVLHGITLPFLLVWSQPPEDLEKPLIQLILKYLVFHGIKLLGAVAACFVLRRHLMVWKIFTPKLVYEAIGMVITMFSVIISYFFTLRIASSFHKQVKNNIGQVWYLKDQ